jgi:polyribonucleotide nucleotidyltransferase
MREGVDFFPLTVDVEERMYAAGKIPGSFFRREGRPTERAILSARLVDRPLRPSFRDGYRCETHVVATVISADEIQPYDVIALNAASAALMVSPIPFEGPIAGVRLGYSNGEWIPMPSYEQLAESVFELVVAGRRNDQGTVDIVMVEAGATENGLRLIAGGQAPTNEAAVARGLEESKAYLAALIDAQLALRQQLEIPAIEWPLVEDSRRVVCQVEAAAKPKVAAVVKIAATGAQHGREEEALAATLRWRSRRITPTSTAATRLPRGDEEGDARACGQGRDPPGWPRRARRSSDLDRSRPGTARPRFRLVPAR